MATSAVTALADLSLPSRCVWCEIELAYVPDGVLLCQECRPLLSGPAAARCPRCAAKVALVGGSCGQCHRHTLHFDSVITLGTYTGALREGVLRLKKPGHEPLAAALARYLASRERTPLAATQVEAILPVPMHWMRRLLRRANSAELVAEELARQLKLPLLHRAARRIRNTRKQGPIRRTERLQNVHGAFRLAADLDVRGRRLLLVDDVLTTGATCDEIAKVLKRAGAVQVDVAVLARAEGR